MIIHRDIFELIIGNYFRGKRWFRCMSNVNIIKLSPVKKFIQTILLVFLQLVGGSVYAFQAYPVFTSTDTSAVVFENATTTATIILDIDANDGNGGVNDGVIYGLIGADASSFSINTFGEITFIASPDYDTPSDTDMDNKYELTVTATDADGTINQPVVVFVAPQVEDLLGEATQLGSDINRGSSGDQFGESVSLSADGSIFAIGAPGNDGNGNEAGQVRVFEWDSNSSDWTQLGSDLDGGAAGDQFGSSVSLSADGSILAVGAPFNDDTGNEAGHVQVFEWDSNSSNWTQLGSDLHGEAAGDQFGSSVSLSVDGNALVVGSALDGFMEARAKSNSLFWNGSDWMNINSNCNVNSDCYNMLLIGNSFFKHYARKLDSLANLAGFHDHNQVEILRGGNNGRPINFWDDSDSREHQDIKTLLDEGNVDFFGMTAGYIPEEATDGFRDWIEYALQNNPDITIFLSIAPIDSPATWQARAESFGYSTIDSYYSDYQINTIIHGELVDSLRNEFPLTNIFTIPTGWAALNLENMFQEGLLAGEIDALIGSNLQNHLFEDTKGHQNYMIRETGALIWLNSIYGVDLNEFSYDTGYETDLDSIAIDIIENHPLCYNIDYQSNNTCENN